ncbi:retrovirus-related pol polyprotein from transposon TNT 1-94 [Tanacetum coccineum]
MHNNIMAAGSKDRPPMLGPGRYSQWRSRFLWYIDTKPNGEGLRKSILSGPYMPSTVLVQAVAATEGNPAIQQHTTIETVLNMTPENKEHFMSEKEAIFLLLTGIGDDIYSTVDACKTANEMWIAIERLQQGESLNVQDVKTNLFWEFGKFTSRDGESMESYYSRFYKLMNELTRNNLQVTTMQVNVQFLQQLQPEWSRFVTVVKQSKEIDTISYHTLFDILKQYQNEVNDIRAERIAKSANPLALLAAAQPYSDNYYQAPKPQRSNATSSSTRPSASTRHKGKEIAKPVTPQSESVRSSRKQLQPPIRMVSSLKRQVILRKLRGIWTCTKNLALALKEYFKGSYKPTTKQPSNPGKTRLKDPSKIVATECDTGALTEGIWPLCKECRRTRMKQIDEHEIRSTLQFHAKIQVNHYTSVSRPQLKSYQVKDKVMPNNTQVKFNHKEVEEHHRISSISRKTKSVIACNDSSKSRTLNVNDVCAECGKYVFNSNHDACVSRYLNDVNARNKKPKVVPISARKPKRKMNKSIATPYKKTVASDSTIQKSKSYYKELYENTNQEWKWWIAKKCPSGYKWTQKPHRTKKIWMPKIRKKDVSTSISPTIGIVSRITNVLKISNSLGSNLSNVPSSSNSLADCITHPPHCLPKLKYVKDQLCSSCEMSKAKRSSFKSKAVPSSKGRLNLLHMDLCGPMRVASINGKKYILVIVDDYSRYTWTLFLRSKDETPEVLKDFLTMIQRNLQAQNSVVERRNRTLVEAARTMLSASKLPLSFWAEAVATACYTQNRSIIISTHGKTAYHIINDRKPSIKHLHIFGCICYITRDGENLDKMKEKGDPCVMVGYFTQSKGYRV